MEWALDRIGVSTDGRTFFAARTSSLTSWPAELRLASRYFVCLVIADGEAENTDEVSGWADRVLAQGMVYCSAWGPGCEVVHDLVDWQVLERDRFRDAAPPVLTTWHDGESLAETVAFFFDSAVPAADFRPDCRSWLLVEDGVFGRASGSRDMLARRLIEERRH